MDMMTIIGILGAGLILIGFLANEFGKLTAESFRYDLINLVGSVLLIWYGVELSAWPFVVLNSIWALVSLRDVVKKIGK